MTTSIPLTDLDGSAGRYGKFETLGDSYRGKIVAAKQSQQTDIDGKLLAFNDGTPRMQWVFSIEQADGEVIALYAKGGKYPNIETGEGESMLSAISTAARKAGAEAIDIGAELVVKFTGLSKEDKGKQAKLYTAGYRPAAPASIPVDLFNT